MAPGAPIGSRPLHRRGPIWSDRSLISLDRGANEWKASLVALASFIGVRRRDVHGEVGELDALCDYSDVSGSCTDPSREVLILLLRPASERVDSSKYRGFNVRVCEIVHRPVRVFENVMKDGGGQFGQCRVWAKGVSNVKCVSQIELARLVSTTMLERSRDEGDGVDEHVRSRPGSGTCGTTALGYPPPSRCNPAALRGERKARPCSNPVRLPESPQPGRSRRERPHVPGPSLGRRTSRSVTRTAATGIARSTARPPKTTPHAVTATRTKRGERPTASPRRRGITR